MAQRYPSPLRILETDAFARFLTARPPLGVFLLGVGVSVMGVGQVVIDPEPLPILAVEVLAPVLLSFVVLYTVRFVTQSDHPGLLQRRISLISLLFMGVALATVTVIVSLDTIEGAVYVDGPFLFAMTTAAGAAVGAPTGIYIDEALWKREQLAEEAVRTAALNQRLEVLNRVLRHNVRNKLNIAIGSADLVRPHVSEPGAQTHIERCLDALWELEAATEKSLRVEQLTNAARATHQMNVVPIIEHNIEDIRYRFPAADIHLHLPDEAMVHASPLLDVAIGEVLENAVVHNDVSDLQVDVSVERLQESVRIDISDSGIGIPDQERAVLLSGYESPLNHSSGVGLWTVIWIAESSDGAVDIIDREPTGTTVRLELPASDRDKPIPIDQG